MVRRGGKLRKIHTEKFKRCVEAVEKSKYDGRRYNPYAVCMSALGKGKALLKKARKKK